MQARIQQHSLNYTEDGCPVICVHCGSARIAESARDYLNGIPCETAYVCTDCGNTVGYWAYGNFDPGYREAAIARASLERKHT
jgi:hypothetical protein